MLGVAQRVARGHGLQADGSGDIACLNLLDFVTLVGVHLQQTAETFLLVLRGVQHGFAGNHNAGVHADEGDLTNERVRHDLEDQGAGEVIVVSVAENRLVIEVEALDRRNVDRGREELNDSVEHALHALVLEGGAAKHRLNLVRDRQNAQTLNDFFVRERAVFEVLVHQLVRSFSGRLDHLLTPFVGGVNEISGDVFIVELHALAGFVPDDGLHFEKVNNAAEVVFSADRNHDRHGVAVQTVLDLIENAEEVRADAVHLVHERDTRHVITLGLTPNGFGLRLNAADGVINHDSAVEHAQGACASRSCACRCRAA